ncbi:MAG: Mut7-C ubiquitin/RNAse domain-containing protein [bacterium]|nr:Mut7-C ubiquitin/RNAse domain-containing protein [bacterium]
MEKTAKFRFYEELNDFLSYDKKKISFSYTFRGKQSIKDAIEAIGVPHSEVDLILVNSKSVSFDYFLAEDDQISVYPVFESLDISDVTKLRPKPLRETRFILDVHLGKLARYLRILGFDTLYTNNYDDPEIVKIASEEKRIILTRDVDLLKNGDVTHGYWIRSQKPAMQLNEVIRRYHLETSFSPFNRCINCNGVIKQVSKDSVLDRLEPKTKKYFEEFYRCITCGRIYWKGSHYKKMKSFVENLIMK